jgi:hypothetical protein
MNNEYFRGHPTFLVYTISEPGRSQCMCPRHILLVVILVIRVLVIAALCRVVVLCVVVAVLVVVTAHVLHSAVVFFTKSTKVFLKKN